MPKGRALRVLVLCTGNSARSQMAEALIRSLAEGRIDVWSAGTEPRPEVHPLAVATMRAQYGLDLASHHPKSVDRFLQDEFDYVLTVCDHAAESCPIFPGRAERLHWSLPDPAAVAGTASEQQRAFDRTASEITRRVRLWLATPAMARRLSGSVQ